MFTSKSFYLCLIVIFFFSIQHCLGQGKKLPDENHFVIENNTDFRTIRYRIGGYKYGKCNEKRLSPESFDINIGVLKQLKPGKSCRIGTDPGWPLGTSRGNEYIILYDYNKHNAWDSRLESITKDCIYVPKSSIISVYHDRVEVKYLSGTEVITDVYPLEF